MVFGKGVVGLKSGKRFLRALVPLALFVLSLGYFVYTKLTGFTPLELPTVEEMKAYGPVLLPLLYIVVFIVRSGASLVFAFIAAGFIRELLPRHVLLNYLSSARRGSYLLAALLSPLLTVCSMCVIPVFAGLVHAGAGIGPAVAFLLAAPAANIMAIILTIDILSWKIAVARLVAAIMIGVFVGYIVAGTRWARRVEERYRSTKAVQAQMVGAKRPLCERLWLSFRFSCHLARTLLPYLLVGIAVAGYVEAYLPPKMVVAYLSGCLGVVLGAVMGAPMYTPTMVEVVFVDALRHLGMSPSSALAFLLGGPMISIPSMMAVSRIVGWRLVVLYSVLAVVGAIIAGLFYHFIAGDIW